MSPPVEHEADVVVLGFGGAGASAAIEAADRGARVLVLERFDGGGATRASGGVVYAGGGTSVQREAGFDDVPRRMLDSLLEETRGESKSELLRGYCERSAEDLRWLEGLGLRFPSRFSGAKTTVPPAGVGLYYSGNEKARAGDGVPRGHLPDGHGQRGKVLFEALAEAARARGVVVRRHCRATRLVTDRQGRVTGVEALQLADRGSLGQLRQALTSATRVSRSARRAVDAFERFSGRRLEIGATGGVVIATGGFVFNAELLRRHAPAFLGAMPLGTAGDDGAGILMGQAVGGAVDRMDRCAAWRFLYPPVSFVSGILVNRQGERFCDESLYGATVGRAIAEQPGGQAWLVIDEAIRRAVLEEAGQDERLRDRPRRELLNGDAADLIFRKLSTTANLHINRHRASTLAGLERRCRLPRGELEATVEEHNRALAAGEPDAFGKPDELRRAVAEPAYLAIACDLSSKLFLGPCFTLGGLRTSADKAEVLRTDGSPIGGLFAAGRAAAGLCAGGYVSGLSIADCVFTGRNAGRAAAANVFGKSANSVDRPKRISSVDAPTIAG